MANSNSIDFVKLTEKWSKIIYESKIFEANPEEGKKKFFVTFPYPYLSGDLHLGHAFTLSTCDAIARYKRIRGYNVLFPFAFHATGEPIVSIAKKVERGDEKQIRTLRMFGIPEEEIKKFTDPYYIVNYFRKRIKESVIMLGASVDWRREFTTIDPEYNKFIEWQYWTLKEKGYVFQGTHPVIWCPSCKSPCGEHDRAEGEEATVIEYVLIKFVGKNILGYKELVFPCGTLRPETVFGVTNIWVNPKAKYAIIKYLGSYWVVSEQCVTKFKEQLKEIVDTGERILGKELVGHMVINPVTKKAVPILPAEFVDPEVATGIVMSVPAHAPYDYIAFKEIQENIEKIKEEYNLSDEFVEIVKKIKPIVIIKIEDFKDIPAKEICEKLGIKSQKDVKKLEEATSIVYKKEFHKGVLNEKCGEYAGKKVSEVKEELINNFFKEGIIDFMYETSEPVICRCGTRCYVKVLENQWFLKFSDPEWKEKVKTAIELMKFTPEEIRETFLKVVDWLKDKACARKSGLGTRLPWDPEWIVETLSDSVIYMAFYTIIHKIRKYEIKPEQLKREFFDYVFLGRRSAEEVEKKTGIKKEILEEIRKEFEYWYGIDLRCSGKDLVFNHLTFALFHHVAIWDNPKYWPKWYIVCGLLKVEGQKMSKSKGNFIVLRDAVKKYGADVVRITLLYSAEGGQDPNWTEKAVLGWKSRLTEIYEFVKNFWNSEEVEEEYIDEWLYEKAKERLRKAFEFFENGLVRSAIEYGINQLFNDLKWYYRRKGNKVSKKAKEVLKWFVIILSIPCPFLAEELWKEVMKQDGFACLQKIEEIGEVNEKIVKREEILKQLLEDIKEILKIYKGKPRVIKIAIPEEWKYRVFKMLKEGKEIRDIIKEVEEAKKYVKYLPKWREMIKEFMEREEEVKILEESKEFLKREFNVEEVKIIEEKELPENKKIYCIPGKFAIILE